MIPKIIHYCWFGDAPKSKLVHKCVNSWIKHCPEYKLIEWNELNFNISNTPLYVRQAYEAKMWAFVSDYVRLYVLYNYGGIYLDTDVELIKPIDKFLDHNAFWGFEDEVHISTAVIGSKTNNKWIGYLLSDYDNREFIRNDSTYDLTTNVNIITNKIQEKYKVKLRNSYQEFDDFVLYTKDFFCPKSYETGMISFSKNTVCIHHFDGSWLTEDEKKKHKKAQRKNRIFTISHIPKRIALKLLGRSRYEALKSIFKNKVK